MTSNNATAPTGPAASSTVDDAPAVAASARDNVLEYTLFRPLICPLLAPRSLHACALAQRGWTAILTDASVWHRWCRMLPPSPSAASPSAGGYALFSHLAGVRCSVSLPLRLDNDDATTVLELDAVQGEWALRLKSDSDALLDLGSNWDTLTTLFGRSTGVLRNELQTRLGELLMDAEWLRRLGRFLPSHDYQVAAFRARIEMVEAADAFTFLDGLASCRQAYAGPTFGWPYVYRHRVPYRATHCPTHLLLAPLHEPHDAAAVRRYEDQIREGARPVVLALCCGLPYNREVHSGMEVNSLTGYMFHDREIANLRAVLQRAEGAAAAGYNRSAAAAAAMREWLAEFVETASQSLPRSAEEQAAERRAALDCQNFEHGNGHSDFLRVGLCLILDGHHKLRAAANLRARGSTIGAAVTVLCYGLQGVAITSDAVPMEACGDADNLFFDSEAIYEALAHVSPPAAVLGSSTS